MNVAKTIKIYMISKVSGCPICGSKKIRRSMRRTFYEKFFFRMILVCPFRCIDCNHRFYKFSLKKFRGY